MGLKYRKQISQLTPVYDRKCSQRSIYSKNLGAWGLEEVVDPILFLTFQGLMLPGLGRKDQVNKEEKSSASARE